MRKVVVVLFSLLIASAALAQQKNEFSVFVTNSSLTLSRDHGPQGSNSLGLAFDRMVTPRISTQLSVNYERHRTYSYIVNPTGTFAAVPPVRFTTVPIDLSARYHFLNETRWKPYLGLGLRYVRQPNISSQFNYQDHIGPEIVGGTAVQFTRSFGLLLDGKVYLGDREQYDSQFKTSFGLLWRF